MRSCKAQGGGFRVFTVLQVNPAGAGLSQLALESLYVANADGRLSMCTWCAVVCYHHKQTTLWFPQLGTKLACMFP